MNLEILNDIPFHLDQTRLLATLRAPEGSDHAAQLAEMASSAMEIGRPKAAFRIATVEAREEKAVVIGGTRFTSKVMSVNLKAVNRVFAYVATCGLEMDEWSKAFHGMLESFWADHIKEMAVYFAMEFLRRQIEERYHPGNLSAMSPGSLPDWPLSQQPMLFGLLGDTEAAVGVHLTPSRLMIPTKSVSGILFSTQETFASCQLCPIQHCPNRRAPYDPELRAHKYA